MTASLRMTGQTASGPRAIAPAVGGAKWLPRVVARVAARLDHPSPHVVFGTSSVPATMSDPRDRAIFFAEPQTMADT